MCVNTCLEFLHKNLLVWKSKQAELVWKMDEEMDERWSLSTPHEGAALRSRTGGSSAEAAGPGWVGKPGCHPAEGTSEQTWGRPLCSHPRYLGCQVLLPSDVQSRNLVSLASFLKEIWDKDCKQQYQCAIWGYSLRMRPSKDASGNTSTAHLCRTLH